MDYEKDIIKFSDWLSQGFETLLEQQWNKGKDGVRHFEEIWHKGKIRFNGTYFDNIDGLSARLICSNLFAKGQLLIILPDGDLKRPAALFSAAIIMTSMESIQAGRDGGRILYFGTQLGIRSQLSHVSIRELNLSTVFSQTFGRGTIHSSTRLAGNLPIAICVYSPLDPTALVGLHSPRWVAIDCGDATSIRWLHPLLESLRHKGIPTIAWSNNPLSDVRGDFVAMGAKTFVWPPRSLFVDSGHMGKISENPEHMFDSEIQRIEINPCQLTGEDINDYSEKLGRAHQALSNAREKLNGRVSRDAVLMGYRLLRLLERLSVPFSTYEFERTQYWRQASIAGLCSGFSRFVEAIKGQAITEPLNEALGCLVDAVDWLKDNDPPIWPALVDLCIEDRSPEICRLFVFSCNAHREMFAHNLLAQEGTSEEELRDMGVFLMSITGLARIIRSKDIAETAVESLTPPHEHPWVPFFVTIPTGHAFRKIAPIVELGKVEMLYYPHQEWLLKWVADQLNTGFAPDPEAATKTIAALTANARPSSQPHSRHAVDVRTPRAIQGRPKPSMKEAEKDKTLDIGTPTDELSRLLDAFEDTEGLEFTTPVYGETEPSEKSDEESEFVDRVLRVSFIGGWTASFAIDELVNFVNPDNSFQLRYIRSARLGDRILYIYGEEQQNLYQLLLSRIHNHPSIRAHIEYIRAWQQEARDKIAGYLRKGHTLDDLHAEMVAHGSTISTSVAISFWAKGCTMRTRDQEDLRRLAEILDMPFTRKCYQLVHSAGNRIHGLHIQLSRSIKTWILRGAESGHMRDEIIDREIQLTFGDVQDALLLLQVQDIREIEGLYYRGTLGRVERE